MRNEFKKALDYAEGLAKAQSFCALQDRAEAQVVKKLVDWHVEVKSHQRIIDKLYDYKFLDEERFANSYVRGKFNQKKWGKYKIRQGLKQLKLPGYLIEQALEQISQEAYRNTMTDLIKKKRKTFQVWDWTAKQKTARHLAGKGFEPGLIMELLAD